MYELVKDLGKPLFLHIYEPFEAKFDSYGHSQYNVGFFELFLLFSFLHNNYKKLNFFTYSNIVFSTEIFQIFNFH